MVQSTATTVDDYLAEASPERAPHLHRIRDLARAVLHDHVEEMRYGMPCFSREVGGGFAFANQKQYISLYVAESAVQANAEALAVLDYGKCCIRFRKPDRIDYGLLEKLLVDTRESPQPFC